MKNIILSTDGTGNAGGIGHGTNVWRIHTAVDRQSHLTHVNHIKQISYYHDGVGSQDKKWLKILGGAFGYGLKRTIKELYTFLVNNYEPGDQIYLFGFSRGAYTVRLLAGMIIGCGILKKSCYESTSDAALNDDVELMYRLLQDNITADKEVQLAKANETSKAAKEVRTIIKKIAQKGQPVDKLADKKHPHIKIRFIGVWDTVDAYAIPSDTFARLLDRYFYISFREHDNSLHKSVESACHALSIDDQRRTFEPVLWGEKNMGNDHQRIKQVWFSGAHSNVGGGYPRQGVAWSTLEWMMLHAREAGVRFVADDINQYIENKDVHDKIYDSRSGFGAYYVFKQRNISSMWKNYTSKTSKPPIHISVFERIAARTDGYAPSNLPEVFEITTTRPMCADEKNNMAVGDAAFCYRYDEDDIQALERQVALALKEHNATRSQASLSEKMVDFVHQWTSYLFFCVMVVFWSGGYLLCNQSNVCEIGVNSFVVSLLISFLYWFTIWLASLKSRVVNHKKDSTFWRTVSADKAWDFLKR